MLDWLKQEWSDAFLRQYIARDSRTGQLLSDKFINAHSPDDALEVARNVFDVPVEFLDIEDAFTDLM